MASISDRPSPKLFTRVLSPGALFFLLILISVHVFAGGATLAWDPVNSPSLVGYMVYYGPAAGNYTSSIDVGNTTTYTVSTLVEGATYHFATTAYDATHTQSVFSNDVSATVPYSAPVAQFSASTTSGTAPLDLNFLNTSTGTISTYAWTFGDGGTSSAQGPAHVYSSAGIYSVGLTVTGPGGSNTKTNSNYITVSAPALVAGFTASTTSGGAPLTVNFTSTSTGTITTYAWTFGDGATSSAQNPSHVYSAAGVYNVGLTVIGPGGSNTKTNSNYITVSIPPVASFSASATSGNAPLTVNFSSTSTGAITTYAWSFGDGATSSAQNPSHVYSAAGVYSVGLTVTGPGGSSTKTNSSYITVSSPPPVASFSASTTSGNAPLTVNFTSASTGTITSYAWNFGDGSTSSTQNPSHVYTTAGVYTVILTVTGPGGSNTKTSSNYVTVTAPTGSSCPCTLWTSTAKPTVAADPDTSAVELGVKFKSDRSGVITGIRYYKSSANRGTHVGSLWTSGGQLLARATFSQETRSGWQQVNFASPVAITANTVYVASYHTNVGQYADDDNYFATAGVDNGPLHALRDGASGQNGIYSYGANPTFPRSGYRATNYWVDVVFSDLP